MLGRFGGSRLSQLTDNIKALDVLPTLTEEFESDLVLLWGITAARGYRSNQVEVVGIAYQRWADTCAAQKT